MVEVSVSNKPRLTVWQWTDYSVIRVISKEEREWLAHHLVCVSFCALVDALALTAEEAT